MRQAERLRKFPPPPLLLFKNSHLQRYAVGTPAVLLRQYPTPPCPPCPQRRAPLPAPTAQSIVSQPILHQSRIQIQSRSHVVQPREFHSSVRAPKDHHFDTLKFVQRLQGEGFSEEQSVALMKALNDVIEESIQNLTRTMVPKEVQEKITYTQKVDFSKLRSELTAVHAGELKPLRSDQERLTSEISRLNARLREEMQRAQSSVRLDLNLEKGRIREESSIHELKIKETDSRIEKEVGDLRGLLESVKFSTLQWLVGVCTGAAALLLSVWRLLL